MCGKNIRAFGIAVIMMLVVRCNQSAKAPQSLETNESSINVEEFNDDSIDNYLEFETISDKNQWLQVNQSLINTNQLRRLVDAYNAIVVLNSIMTDFDLQMRGYDHNEVVNAIKSIEVTKVKDSEVISELKAYQDEMLYLLSVNPNDVDQNIHNPWKAKDDLYSYLSKKYYVGTFGEFSEDKYSNEYKVNSSVPELDELRKKRGENNMVAELKQKYSNAKDFDARCIYAIELGHAYEADIESWGADFCNPAIPIMESIMKERKYSLYLNELWRKWRVLYQTANGASKDSEIPNRLYNKYRNICACTILSYIGEHPQDINAINEFLVMACKDNILREGDFSYGNQAIVDKYYLFPEIYAKYKEKRE